MDTATALSFFLTVIVVWCLAITLYLMSTDQRVRNLSEWVSNKDMEDYGTTGEFASEQYQKGYTRGWHAAHRSHSSSAESEAREARELLVRWHHKYHTGDTMVSQLAQDTSDYLRKVT